MNKINFFYISMPGDLPITTLIGDDTPRSATITLVAGLILEGQPEEYEVSVSTSEFTVFNKQKVPRGIIIKLGDTGLITTQLTMTLTLNNAAINTKYNMEIKLYKEGVEIDKSNSDIYVVGEKDVQ